VVVYWIKGICLTADVGEKQKSSGQSETEKHLSRVHESLDALIKSSDRSIRKSVLRQVQRELRHEVFVISSQSIARKVVSELLGDKLGHDEKKIDSAAARLRQRHMDDDIVSQCIETTGTGKATRHNVKKPARLESRYRRLLRVDLREKTRSFKRIPVVSYLIELCPELAEGVSASGARQRANKIVDKLKEEGIVSEQEREIHRTKHHIAENDTKTKRAIKKYLKEHKPGRITIVDYLLETHPELFEGVTEKGKRNKAHRIAKDLVEGPVNEAEEFFAHTKRHIAEDDKKTRKAIDDYIKHFYTGDSKKISFQAVARKVVSELLGEKLDNDEKKIDGVAARLRQKYTDDPVVKDCYEKRGKGKGTKYDVTAPKKLEARLKRLVREELREKKKPAKRITVISCILELCPELAEGVGSSGARQRAHNITDKLKEEGIVSEQEKELHRTKLHIAESDTKTKRAIKKYLKEHKPGRTTIVEYLLETHSKLFEGLTEKSKKTKAASIAKELIEKGPINEAEGFYKKTKRHIAESDRKTKKAIDGFVKHFYEKELKGMLSFQAVARKVVSELFGEELGHDEKRIDRTAARIRQKYTDDDIVKSCYKKRGKGKGTKYDVTAPKKLESRLKTLVRKELREKKKPAKRITVASYLFHYHKELFEGVGEWGARSRSSKIAQDLLKEGVIEEQEIPYQRTKLHMTVDDKKTQRAIKRYLKRQRESESSLTGVVKKVVAEEFGLEGEKLNSKASYLTSRYFAPSDEVKKHVRTSGKGCGVKRRVPKLRVKDLEKVIRQQIRALKKEKKTLEFVKVSEHLMKTYKQLFAELTERGAKAKASRIASEIADANIIPEMHEKFQGSLIYFRRDNKDVKPAIARFMRENYRSALSRSRPTYWGTVRGATKRSFGLEDGSGLERKTGQVSKFTKEDEELSECVEPIPGKRTRYKITDRNKFKKIVAKAVRRVRQEEKERGKQSRFITAIAYLRQEHKHLFTKMSDDQAREKARRISVRMVDEGVFEEREAKFRNTTRYFPIRDKKTRKAIDDFVKGVWIAYKKPEFITVPGYLKRHHVRMFTDLDKAQAATRAHDICMYLLKEGVISEQPMKRGGTNLFIGTDDTAAQQAIDAAVKRRYTSDGRVVKYSERRNYRSLITNLLIEEHGVTRENAKKRARQLAKDYMEYPDIEQCVDKKGSALVIVDSEFEYLEQRLRTLIKDSVPVQISPAQPTGVRPAAKAATNGKGPVEVYTIQDLVDKTGLSPEGLRKYLNTPGYRSLLGDAVKGKKEGTFGYDRRKAGAFITVVKKDAK
jgi:hypothetical protein